MSFIAGYNVEILLLMSIIFITINIIKTIKKEVK